MSKQSDAKAAQSYTTAVQNCGNCASLTFEMRFPTWILQRIERGDAGYDKDYYKQEAGHKCGVGGFAIRKTAHCSRWSAKPEAA